MRYVTNHHLQDIMIHNELKIQLQIKVEISEEVTLNLLTLEMTSLEASSTQPLLKAPTPKTPFMASTSYLTLVSYWSYNNSDFYFLEAYSSAAHF